MEYLNADPVDYVNADSYEWDPDPPEVDDAETAMIAVAAGNVDEGWVASWLRERTREIGQPHSG